MLPIPTDPEYDLRLCCPECSSGDVEATSKVDHVFRPTAQMWVEVDVYETVYHCLECGWEGDEAPTRRIEWFEEPDGYRSYRDVEDSK